MEGGMRSPCVLVTGGTGILGRPLVWSLVAQGYQVMVLSRKDALASELGLPVGVEIIRGDLTQDKLGLSQSKLEALARELKVCWHCAAYVGFDARKAHLAWQVNVQGTRRILKLLDMAPQASLHYVSTAYVAGKTPGLIFEDPVAEVPFRNTYEQTKNLAERLVFYWARSRHRLVKIYRPGIIIWPGARSQGIGGVLRSIELVAKAFGLKGGDILGIPACTMAYLNIVSLDSLIEALIILSKDLFPPGIYHLTNPHPIRVVELLRIIGETVGVRVEAICPQLPRPLTLAEKFCCRLIKDLLPYGQVWQHFESSRTRALVGDLLDLSLERLKELLEPRPKDQGWRYFCSFLGTHQRMKL